MLYGPRVIGLKTAAEKGDFAAFEEQDGAARLFNSGTSDFDSRLLLLWVHALKYVRVRWKLAPKTPLIEYLHISLNIDRFWAHRRFCDEPVSVYVIDGV